MKNNRGSVLVSVFIAVLVISILAVAGAGLSFNSLNRAIAAENRSQLYYTALATVNLFVDAIIANDPDDPDNCEFGYHLSNLISDKIENEVGLFDVSNGLIEFDFGPDRPNAGISRVRGSLDFDVVANGVTSIHITARAAFNKDAFNDETHGEPFYEVTRTLFGTEVIDWTEMPIPPDVVDFSGGGQVYANSPALYFYRLPSPPPNSIAVNHVNIGAVNPTLITIEDGSGRTVRHPVVIFVNPGQRLEINNQMRMHTNQVFFILAPGSELCLNAVFGSGGNPPLLSSNVVNIYVLHQYSDVNRQTGQLVLGADESNARIVRRPDAPHDDIHEDVRQRMFVFGTPEQNNNLTVPLNPINTTAVGAANPPIYGHNFNPFIPTEENEDYTEIRFDNIIQQALDNGFAVGIQRGGRP